MKVLIAGGYGFIGSSVAERLFKEGHEVFIIDNLSSGLVENVAFKHKAYHMNVESEECEDVFRSYSFDAVVYAVTSANPQSSIINPIQDSLSSLIGLENILHFCGKYHVSKFVYLSSADVYGKNENHSIRESSHCNPISPYGYHKLIGEEFCKKWSEFYHFDCIILRIPNVYGPKDITSNERGFISVIIDCVMHLKDIHVNGDGQQISDFIFVDDVVDAIYRTITSEVEGIFNLSTNHPTSLNEIISIFKENLPTVKYVDMKNQEVLNGVLDNSKMVRELDWTPKYSIEEGITKTYEFHYMKKNRKKRTSFRNIINLRQTFYQSYKYLMPFIENIILFIIFAIMDFGTFQTNHLIDYKLVYVLMVGIFLGKTQAILSCFLTVILYIYENIAHGREFISLFLDNNTISHIAMYLFFGLVLGYIIDKKTITANTLKEEYIHLQNKYDFLDEVFQETRRIKDQLQNQIIYTEDSVGKMFELASKLDSLEPDDIFNGSIAVLEQTMKTNAVSIYLTSKNSNFLRLVSKSNSMNSHFPNSIRIDGENAFCRVLTKKKTVLNYDLDPNVPILIAPILRSNEVIGVVCLNEVSFERLTLYYQNLFEVVIKLISSSMNRAYEYVSVTQPSRYIEDTTILKPEFFMKVLDSKEKAKKQLNIPYCILEINESIHSREVIAITQNAIRETDTIGLDSTGKLLVLLSNSTEKEATFVYDRLRKLGLSIRFKQEVGLYV